MGLGLWALAHESFVLTSGELDEAKVEAARTMLKSLQQTPPWLFLLALAVTPGVIEELCFRGYLFSACLRVLSPARTIVLTSLLFGLFHVLTGSSLLLERFVPTTLVGLFLGWVAYRSGSVWPGIALHVIYNGVDGSLFHAGSQAAARRALGLAESDRIVLYAGNLKVEKGCLDLLHAFPSVLERYPDSHLVFVGDGPARTVLARRRDDLDLDGSVTIAGAHPHAQLAEWMRAADVLCLPSHAEGVPNVVLEAMSSGLPVVASRVGGIPEVLPAFAGILHAARDVPALSQAVVEAMSRDWDKPRITQHAGGFNWEDNIRSLDGVLQAALNR